MKKALQISIAKTLFTVEEDAYIALDAYLAEVKQHFDDTPERDEIVTDIETRIAEQLLESKEHVITLPTVERVTKQMGSVNDFDDADTAKHSKVEHTEHTKKLYRDGDDKMIAGVCSGLAAYFGLNVVWTRIAFFVLALFNGVGILIYVILWMVLPEAKSASQKLEMVGTPVTLSTLSETVNERVAELRSSRPRRIGYALTVPFRMIGHAIRLIVGAGFVFTTGVAIVGTMIMSGFLLSGSTWVADDVPLSALLPGAEQWLIVIAVMFAGLVPLVFIFLAGISLLLRRNVISLSVGLGLLSVWFVALLISGFGAARVVSNYQQFVETSPSHQEITRTIPLEGTFDSLDLERGVSIRIVQATSSTATLTATGPAKYIDTYQTRIENGTLTIEPKRITRNKICIFCALERPQLTLAVPTLSTLNARHGASVRSNGFPASNILTVTLENGSYADLAVDLVTLTASAENGSRINISGTADAASLTATHGSDIGASELQVNDATVAAKHGSFIDLHAERSLKAKAEHGSSIRYFGKPDVTEESLSGSEIEAR